MGLSRSEIELLIRAKNDAQGAFDQLNKQIATVTGETTRASAGMDTFEKKTKASGVAAQATAVGVGILAERLARGLVTGFKDTINAANRLDAGLIGLSSVAKAFGGDADRAQAAARRLASDGLMSVGEAAAGLKNLLGSGFALPEAITLMERFKDSAAFGRQGALGFGEAIVGATQGIKNGNSIMVDNVGITKNLSQILVEAGYSATDLNKATSDTNIRMALFNGILKESRPMLGDTAKFLDTAAGKQAQFSAQVEIAQQKLGKALQPALSAVLSTLEPMVKVIGNNADTMIVLGAATTALILPTVALRVANTLGITAFASMGKEITNVVGLFGQVRNVRDFGAAVQLTGGAAQGALAALGPFGIAIGVVTAGMLVAQRESRQAKERLDAFVASIVNAKDQANTLAAANDKLQIAQDRVNKSMDAGPQNRMVRAILDSALATFGLSGNTDKLAAAEYGRLRRAPEYVAAQEAINRAVRDGAEASISLTDAIQRNAAADLLRMRANETAAGVVTSNLARQKEYILAELLLGKITQQVANERLAALGIEERAQNVSKNRISLSSSIANSEKQVQAEIKATGFTMAELLVRLKENEDATKKWLEQHGVSDETIKALDDRLKGYSKTQTKAAEETRRHKDALEEIASAGDGWKGTLAGINPVLAETVKKLLEAGVSAGAVGLEYKLTDTQVRALTKSVEEEKAAHDKATAAQKKHAEAMEELDSAGEGWKGTLDEMHGGMVRAIQGYLEAGVSQAALAEAYGLTDTQIKAISRSMTEQKKIQEITNQSQRETADLMEGYYSLVTSRSGSSADAQIAAINRWRAKEIGQLKSSDENYQQHYDAILAVASERTSQVTNATRIELSRQARDAEQNYREQAAMFGRYAATTVDAHKRMIEAQLAEAGKVPTFWQTGIFPAITSTVKNIGASVTESFADMLTGAKGFGQGFTDIWKSIKSSVTDILNQILKEFINSFLKGMLGALRGQQGAFGAAFAGLFSGGGGGGAGGGFNIGSLLGGGGKGGSPQPGTPGWSWSGGGEAAGGGTNWGGVAAGAGIGLGAGFGIGNKYGGTKGALGGAASGALAGAAFGGPIGAGIGAAAGLIGGLIGGAKNNTKDQRAAFANELGYKSVDELFAALQQNAPDQAGELRNRALNQIGKKDTGANQKWMEDVAKALGDAKDKASALANTVDSLGLTWEDMGQKVRSTKIDELGEGLVAQTKQLVAAGYEEDRVLAKQAAGYSELYAKAIKYNEQLPASMQANIQKLAEMGLLVDENGNKVITSNAQLADSYQELKDVQVKLAGELSDSERDELTKREAALQDYIKKGKESIERFGGAIYDAVAVKGAGKAVTDLGKELGKVPGWASTVAGEIEDAFGRIKVPRIRVPWGYDEEGGGRPPGGPGPDRPGGGPNAPEGAAAGGVMASRPGLVIFGEGGETEVGGPASFFKRIFEQIGLGNGGGGNVIFEPGTFQITVMDANGLDEAMEKRIIPKLIDAVKNNKRAARTELRAGLGMA